MQIVKVGNYEVGQGHPLMLMAGPCVLEGYERSLMIGQRTKAICDKLGIPYVFKASFDKANRSSYASFRGPGIEEGLKLLAQIKKDLGVPVVTDIHEPWQADKAAEVVDILANPGLPVPSDRFGLCSCQNRQDCQCKKRPVPCTLGHEECYQKG